MRKLLTIIAAMIICDAYGEYADWIVDGDVYETTTCDSGGNITMPTQGNPQKEGGFRFIGWKEGSVYDLLAKNGTSYTPTSGNGGNTWTATFAWGTVTGYARCSGTGGTVMCWNDATGASCATNSNPSTSGTTQYCWCKLTNSGGLVDESSLAWVFRSNASSASNCASSCPLSCGYSVYSTPGFRRAVFGVTQ